jgi:hypothetical protein
VERGYLLIAAVFEALITCDLETAQGLTGEAATIARRFDDTGLLTFSRHLEGRVQVYRGEVQAGVAILDEAILTVTRTEIAPIMAGLLFCSAMLTVYEPMTPGTLLSRTSTGSAYSSRPIAQQSSSAGGSPVGKC